MDRDGLLKRLADFGIKPALLKDVPDAALAEIHHVLNTALVENVRLRDEAENRPGSLQAASEPSVGQSPAAAPDRSPGNGVAAHKDLENLYRFLNHLYSKGD